MLQIRGVSVRFYITRVTVRRYLSVVASSNMSTAIVLFLLGAVTSVHSDGSLSLVARVVDKCSDHSDIYSCLKLKAVSLLDRALTVDVLPVSEFVTITKDPKANVTAPAVKTEGELEASLPRDLEKKSLILDEMLDDRVSRYLDSRTIQLSMPADVLEGDKIVFIFNSTK